MTNQYLKLMKKKANISLFIIMGIVAICLIAGAIFFVVSQQNKTNSNISSNNNMPNNFIKNEESKTEELTQETKTNSEIITNCDEMNCFEQKFSECQPATVMSKLMDNLIFFYEIIGPKDGLCEVKSKFIANQNPEWVEKEMTCKYDNTRNFETAVQDMSNCQGDLYNLINENLDEQTKTDDEEEVAPNLFRDELGNICEKKPSATKKSCFFNEKNFGLKFEEFLLIETPQYCKNCVDNIQTYSFQCKGDYDCELLVKDCIFDDDCKEGFSCEKNTCVKE